jgi:hypothetical protein
MSVETRLFESAHEAGLKAGREVGVTPMVVGSPTELFGNEIDWDKSTYHVSDGVCGFAGVIIKPARGKFVSLLKKMGRGWKHYYGGFYMTCREFNQSLTRKEAYCEAFARVLGEAGLRAYVDSRMD